MANPLIIAVVVIVLLVVGWLFALLTVAKWADDDDREAFECKYGG
jgi:hypothetical protein